MTKSVGEILEEKGGEVIAISSESTIPEAARMMSHRKIGLLIVLIEKINLLVFYQNAILSAQVLLTRKVLLTCMSDD
jgi:hypothetical protein